MPAERIKAAPIIRVLIGLAVTAMTFDACFWDADAMGFSVAVFAFVLAAVILVNREPRPWTRTTRLMAGLWAGALFATVLETGITNTLVLLILLIAWAGETFFRDVDSPWGRGLSQVMALIRAPGYILEFCGISLAAVFSGRLWMMGGLMGACLLALPALILALIFGMLLASGNTIFGNWAYSFFDWFCQELLAHLNPVRIFLWFFVALLALPLLRPGKVPASCWSWMQRLPRLPEMGPARAATWSSGLVLVVLNILFFIANFADAIFLWSGQTLPKGVTYSGFVHHGVNTLIVTVLLSAFVLTTIFQQALGVVRNRELKLLGIIWIAQNLFLLLSVGLRLKLYIEAYDMTVLRLGVIIFLFLVAVGYALLTIKILWDHTLSWLVGGCVLAIFGVLFITQYLDLAGWSANYNEAQWEKDRSRNLDIGYIYQLGPAGWPALQRAKSNGVTAEKISDDEKNTKSDSRLSARDQELNCRRTQMDMAHWREFSLRAYLNRWALDDKAR